MDKNVSNNGFLISFSIIPFLSGRDRDPALKRLSIVWGWRSMERQPQTMDNNLHLFTQVDDDSPGLPTF